MEFVALAYYRLAPLGDPNELALEHKEMLSKLEGRGRIYHSLQGVNAQLSLPKIGLPTYVNFMRAKFCVPQNAVHTQPCVAHVFPKLTVKVRPQLVALNCPIRPELSAQQLSAQEWEQMLSHRSSELVVLDVRNQWEWELGHFQGALPPKRTRFRQFCDFDRDFDLSWGRERPILMYCTGGIRCEVFSAHLRQKGYHNLYQLRGGVLGYVKEIGARHWRGKLFVFDDRLILDIGAQTSCGQCQHCSATPDSIFNCANVDCNALFLSCSPCWRSTFGCCQYTCRRALRRRLIDSDQPGRPFRRYEIQRVESKACRQKQTTVA